MRNIFIIMMLVALVGGCAPRGPYDRDYAGPYSTTYGIPTVAMTAAGAAIGSGIGPRRDRGQNAVIGGMLGAMAGTATEYAINEQARQRDYQAQQYYQQQYAYRQQNAYREAREIEHREIRTGTYLRVAGTSVLNIRSGPGTSYPVVGVLRGGESIRVVRFNRGWAQVQSDDGYLTGWVSGRYLRSTNNL